MTRDKSLKVLLYCSGDEVAGYEVDVSFPTSIEIRINQAELKANLRGLKNKPGTTRPADITRHLHLTSTYENSITVTYALTPKVRIATISNVLVGTDVAQKYHLILNLAREHPPPSLVQKLKEGRAISKDQVIRESKTTDSTRFEHAET